MMHLDVQFISNSKAPWLLYFFVASYPVCPWSDKKNIIHYIYMRKTVHLCYTQHDIRLQQSDHVYLRHLWAEYRSILLVDMLTDSGPTYWLIVGWYVDQVSADISTDIDRYACWPTLGQYFTATWPTLGWYFSDTWPTVRSFGWL